MQQAPVLLINPPLFAVSDIFRTSINPPLNLAYLLSALAENGLSATVLDLGLESLLKYGVARNNESLHRLAMGNPPAEYLSFLRARIHEVVGQREPRVIAMNADNAKLAFFCLREAKKIRPDAASIVGGTVASSMYGVFLSKPQIDYVAIDEAEETFPALVACILAGRPCDSIPGIVHRRDGSILRTAPAKAVDLSSGRMPSYDAFDMDSYFRLNGRRLMVLSARGCRGRCRFCGIPRHLPIRARPAEDVVREIELLQRKYAVNDFTFFNSMLNVNADHLNALTDELRARKIGIRFGCYLKADRHLADDTFERLKAAGCATVDFGVESGSRRMLEACRKDIDPEYVVKLVLQAKKTGLNVRCTFIWGMPGETWRDFFDTLRLYARLRPSCSGFFEFHVYEASEYYHRIEHYSDAYHEDALRISMLRNPLERKLKFRLTALVSKIF